MSATEIFRSGTLTIASQFGVETEYGQIAPGFIANLVLLDANPFETISAWRNIETVILRGEVIERDSLQAH